MKNQTAVEWLEQKLKGDNIFSLDVVLQQAKAMERNQKDEIENKIIHFAEWLTNKHTSTLITLFQHFEEEYYNTEVKK